MALPPGIPVKTVTVGIASFFDGTLAEGTATITAPVNVIHTPTNRPLFSSLIQKRFVDGEASFNLAPTDAAGLNRVDWSYKLSVVIQGALVQPDPIYFLLPEAGPDTIDLDGLVTVPSSAGIPISVDVLTSAQLPEQMATVAADTDSAFSVAQRAASVAAVKQDLANPATDLGSFAGGAFVSPADSLAVARVERHGALRASASQVQALGRAQRATEWTESWADLTAWNDTGVQVSGGRLYGISGASPSAAVRSISIPAGGRFRATTVLHYTGTVKSLYFGISNGAADSAPISPDNNSVLLGIIGSGGQAGKIGTFVGTAATGLASALGASPSPVAAGDYQFTVAADETFLSLSARRVGSQNDDWVARIPRSGLPGGTGGITNLVISNADSNGLTGSSWDKVLFTNELTGPVAGTGVSDPWTVGTRSAAGVNWRLQVPAGYMARKPAPLVVFMHQSLTGLASNPYTETRMANVTAAFAAAGYLLASSDNGNNNSVAGGVNDKYGNQAGLDDYEALIRWVQDHFAVGPILLLGPSMGGEFVENMLAQRRVGGIAAVATICPGLDLIAAAANPTYNGPILTAYGATDTTDLATKVVGYNPIAHTGAQLRGVPQRFYVASDDPTAPPASHVTPLVAKLTAVAAEASVVTVTGGHLPAAAYQGSDLVSFYSQYV